MIGAGILPNLDSGVAVAALAEVPPPAASVKVHQGYDDRVACGSAHLFKFRRGVVLFGPTGSLE